MGRSVRQKRKNRSSRPKVTQPNSRKRPVNPTGNPIIAQNWDKKQTLVQNYRRLGLMNRLRQPTGGIELTRAALAAADAASTAFSERGSGSGNKQLAQPADPFRIDSLNRHKAVREMRVERDAAGKIVRLVGGGEAARRAANPLNDALNELEEEEEGEGEDEFSGFPEAPSQQTPVVQALEKIARRPVGPRQVRHQSERERAWLQALVDHYGRPRAAAGAAAAYDEDVLAAMARDRRRNPMQRTAADLKRRLCIFLATTPADEAA